MFRKSIVAATIAVSILTVGQAQAAGATGPVVAGAVVGGVVGSTYEIGLGATLTAARGLVTGAASSVLGVIPAVATGVAGTIAATSAPVMAGVVLGGSAAYLVYRSSR